MKMRCPFQDKAVKSGSDPSSVSSSPLLLGSCALGSRWKIPEPESPLGEELREQEHPQSTVPERDVAFCCINSRDLSFIAIDS